MGSPVIYFRGSLAEEAEKNAAKEHFRVIERRSQIEEGELVIPRYSALPFNSELCEDIKHVGAEPINTYRQHCYVADIRNWYHDLAGFTPQTWFYLDQIPDVGPFVLKGATNSKKLLWNTHMFAETKQDAMQVFIKLGQDSTVGVQPIYVRRYVPLRNLGKGLNDLPISEEYRFFVLDGKIVASGFYWSSHTDDLPHDISADNVPKDFLKNIIDIVQKSIRFWVMDIARTAAGDWILIELNDGQQSGLSEIDPAVFYKNLKSVLCPIEETADIKLCVVLFEEAFKASSIVLKEKLIDSLLKTCPLCVIEQAAYFSFRKNGNADRLILLETIKSKIIDPTDI